MSALDANRHQWADPAEPCDEHGVRLSSHLNVSGECGWCKTPYPCPRRTAILLRLSDQSATERT